MADIRKEQERDELHRAIWAIADGLRGSVDGWDFKSYVLGMMFYRYISENLTNYINDGEIEAGNEGFDYALLSDKDAEQAREDMVNTKGFFILPSELFCNIRKKAANDENLNMTLETVFKHIEESAKGSESEANFSGLFDDMDVNSILHEKNGFVDVLLAFMKTSEEHALYVIQSVDKSYQEVCGRTFVAYDPFASFAYLVLRSGFPYVVNETAANILRFVAQDVRRFSAQHLIEDIKNIGVEPMIEEILDS